MKITRFRFIILIVLKCATYLFKTLMEKRRGAYFARFCDHGVPMYNIIHKMYT